LFPDGAEPLAYAAAVSGPDPRKTIGLIIGGAIVLDIVLAASAHIAFGPGALIIVVLMLVYSAIDKPRAVVVSDRGVAVVGRSAWSGRSHEILSICASAEWLEPAIVQRGSYVEIPTHKLWIRRKEYESLRNALLVPGSR
jgi:hypothetical protein